MAADSGLSRGYNWKVCFEAALTPCNAIESAMRVLVVQSERERLPGFTELCQRFCDEQRIPDHLDDEQAAESVLDQFRRVIGRELALLEIRSVC